MTKYSKTLLACAAVAGLYTGTVATRAFAADDKAGQPAPSQNTKDKASCSGKDGCQGKTDSKAKDSTDKASCSGKSGCQGKADSTAKSGADKASCKAKDSCSAKKADKTG